MGVIEFKNYYWSYKGYKGFTLKNLNLSIKKGEFLGIIGPVDTGRSTFCMSILGLVPHLFPGKIKGELIVDGLNVEESELADLSQKVGLVLQSPETQLTGAGISVEEELAFGLQNIGISRKEMIKRVNKMIKLLELTPFRKRSPYELSGGQQQKVAIASVLIMNPKILVLDEPTAKLDPLGTKQVFDFIKKLSRKGITIILNSQKIDYLAEFADRICLMNNNKIIKLGNTREVLTNIKLLKRNGVQPSVFTTLSYELKREKKYKGKLCLTMKDAEKMMREVKRK